MARQTRIHRRGVYRQLPARAGWRRIRPGEIRRTLAALEALFRR